MEPDYKKLWLANIKVLILGSYYPDKAKKKLDKLKYYLKQEGFSKTGLAKDFDSAVMDNRFSIKGRTALHSIWEMKSSDFLVFLFVKEGTSYGPVMELQECVDFDCLSKNERTFILLEHSFLEKQGKSQIFRDTLELINEMGVDFYEFDDDKIPLKYVKTQIYSRILKNWE